MEHIGIVGTGVMGLTAAGKIISAGHTVSAYDVSSDAAARAGQLGVQIAETPAEVAGKSDMVLLFLPGPVVGHAGR